MYSDRAKQANCGTIL